MTEFEFDSGMKRLADCFGKTLTPDEMLVYRDVLRDVTIEDWHDGLMAVMRSDRQYMPRPGQVLRACGGRKKGKRPREQEMAGSAETDRDRPARIGRNSVEGYSPESRAYHAELIRHMSPPDFEMANAARREALDAMPSDLRAEREGSDG